MESTLLALVTLLALASAATSNLPPANALTDDGSLKSCIDDSDCKGLGPGNTFRCFQVTFWPKFHDAFKECFFGENPRNDI